MKEKRSHKEVITPDDKDKCYGEGIKREKEKDKIKESKKRVTTQSETVDG